ncbi:MAG: exodeoxyribonuclease VII large subunit [Xanthomonadales bacterium]|nr:exodeoxyribonuclease VII large subunit [Xanthomonadales bacterium]
MSRSAARQIHTPSSLLRLVRQRLERDFPAVWVQGEIGDLRRPGSGHLYFRLKDGEASLPCVLFRSQFLALACQPEEGLLVLARGRLSLYEARGDFQLVVEHLEEAGEGALRRAFEALRAKLAAEGLLDPGRKRRVPCPPHRLALITSPDGAVRHDVQSILARRFPLLPVDLFPVTVQGARAPAEIVAALRLADRSGRYGAILIARGGGSPVDLMAFNDETVARAIALCRTPVVSAIGHETDVTIADLVADLRAPTPSAAAELLTPERGQLLARLDELAAALAAEERRGRDARWQRLDLALQWLRHRRPSRRPEALALAGLGLRLRNAAAARLQALRPRLLAADPRGLRVHPAGRSRALLGALDRLRDRFERGLPDRLRQRALALLERLAALHRLDPRRRLAAARGRMQALEPRLKELGGGLLLRRGRRLASLAPARLMPLLALRAERLRDRVRDLGRRAPRAMTLLLGQRRMTLEARGRDLSQLGPEGVLRRGFAILLDEAGRVVDRVGRAPPGLPLTARLADGRLDLRVLAAHPAPDEPPESRS